MSFFSRIFKPVPKPQTFYQVTLQSPHTSSTSVTIKVTGFPAIHPYVEVSGTDGFYLKTHSQSVGHAIRNYYQTINGYTGQGWEEVDPTHPTPP